MGAKELKSGRVFEFVVDGRVVDKGIFGPGLKEPEKKRVLTQRLERLLARDDLKKVKKEIKATRREILDARDKIIAEKNYKRGWKLVAKRDEDKKKLGHLRAQRLELEEMAFVPTPVLTGQVAVKDRKKVVFSPPMSRNLNLSFKEFSHEPVPTSVYDLEANLKRMQDLYEDSVKKIFKAPEGPRKDNGRRHIFRVLYAYKDRHGKKIVRGAGGGSYFMMEAKEAEHLVRPAIANVVAKLYTGNLSSKGQSYFSGGVIPKDFDLVGYTVEYIDSEGPRLRGKNLRLEATKWEKAKVAVAKRRSRTKCATEAERDERLQDLKRPPRKRNPVDEFDGID